MDWQSIAAITASIGALIISLYTAKSTVRKADVEALAEIGRQLRVRIEELEEELAHYKQKYEDLKHDYDRILRLYNTVCRFVRRMGFDPENLEDGEK
jgi:hypothetical protein